MHLALILWKSLKPERPAEKYLAYWFSPEARYLHTVYFDSLEHVKILLRQEYFCVSWATKQEILVTLLCLYRTSSCLPRAAEEDVRKVSAQCLGRLTPFAAHIGEERCVSSNTGVSFDQCISCTRMSPLGIVDLTGKPQVFIARSFRDMSVFDAISIISIVSAQKIWVVATQIVLDILSPRRCWP